MSGFCADTTKEQKVTLNTVLIMTKTIYETPLVRVLEVRTGGMFMASGEKMRAIEGSWEEDDE